MKKSYVLYLILSTMVFGCGPKENPDIIIINESDRAFKNVFIRPLGSKDSIDLGALNIMTRLKGSFIMSDEDYFDGCYIVNAIAENGSDVQKCIGYYTNGGSLNRGFRFTIRNDTVLLDSW